MCVFFFYFVSHSKPIFYAISAYTVCIWLGGKQAVGYACFYNTIESLVMNISICLYLPVCTLRHRNISIMFNKFSRYFVRYHCGMCMCRSIDWPFLSHGTSIANSECCLIHSVVNSKMAYSIILNRNVLSFCNNFVWKGSLQSAFYPKLWFFNKYNLS